MRTVVVFALLVLASASVVQVPAAHAQRVEWPTYGNDPGATKYSPLAHINRGNVAHLTLACEWRVGERALVDSDSTKARPNMMTGPNDGPGSCR